MARMIACVAVGRIIPIAIVAGRLICGGAVFITVAVWVIVGRAVAVIVGVLVPRTKAIEIAPLVGAAIARFGIINIRATRMIGVTIIEHGVQLCHSRVISTRRHDARLIAITRYRG